jgi:signal transduction histidine kinase
LCKKIIQNHQGDIFITTAHNEPGTIFHIILPQKQREIHELAGENFTNAIAN